jgi:polyisoprenyl-phosphate glycosyltransferase
MDQEQKLPPALLSVVTPCYNEAGGLREFVDRIAAAMTQIGQGFEIVFVNDGSTDGTLAELRDIAASRDDVTVVNLTRNFGKEIALTAGLSHAAGDAILVIDSDLQDPPEVIPEFIAKYREGYDIVYGRRLVRQGETLAKKMTARLFYRMMRNIGPVRLPENVGDFRLMSRRSVDALLQLPETHRFMKGLFAWIGYPAAPVDYVRHPRFTGRTKWNYGKLVDLSIEGITSFTTFPLRLTSYLGFLLAFLAFATGLIYFVRTLVFGDPVQGFPRCSSRSCSSGAPNSSPSASSVSISAASSTRPRDARSSWSRA